MKTHTFLLTSLPFLLSSCAFFSPDEPIPMPVELAKDDHGNYLGCSWYCGAPSMQFSASSSLSKDGTIFKPLNAHDISKDTAWIAASNDSGIGEKLTFTFDMRDRKPEEYDPNRGFGINSVSIINGYAKSEKLWGEYTRAKSLKVILDGKTLKTISLKDTIDPQSVLLPKMAFHPGKVHTVTFEITEVYPGTKYPQPALADFFFDGFGVH